MHIQSGVRLLLISSSVVHGKGYLDHAENEIRSLLGSIRRVLFIPYALFDYNGYELRAGQRFRAMDLDLESIHRASDERKAIMSADAVFVGGGNTFRLLKALYDRQLLGAIREKVFAGIPYIGSSAGTVVAAPTMRTTNDMPIVEPPSLASLNLVPFQINPHYLDADPASKHMGETREERLLQYLEENSVPVIGLREAGMLSICDGAVTLKGLAGARVFRRGSEPLEVQPIAELAGILT